MDTDRPSESQGVPTAGEHTPTASAEPEQSAGARRPHATVPVVERDGHRRQCKATTRSGRRCRSFAVEDMQVCRMHGGASPQARAAALRRKTEAQATALLEVVWDPHAPAVTNPVAALLALAGKLQHATDVLGARLESTDLDGVTAQAWYRVVREQRQALEGIERLDLFSKQVAISEGTGKLLAMVVRGVLDRLALTPEQSAVALIAVPEEFRRVAQLEAGDR